MSERPFTRLSDLVQEAAQALRPHLDIPFALFGHSMGALIAFELARQLRRQDSPAPVHLFVSGARAPQRPDPDAPVHQLPDSELIEQVRRRYDGIPGAILDEAELMQLFIPLIRTDFEVVETYVYRDDKRLDCPISCFGGRQDRRVSHEELEAWRDQTGKSFKLQVFPGDHFFLRSAQPLVLRVVSEELSVLSTQATVPGP